MSGGAGYEANMNHLLCAQPDVAFCYVQFRGLGVEWWSFLFSPAFAAMCTVLDRYLDRTELGGEAGLARM
tara:strand:+ start:257 stop:466 length:210 start_codon:yes stop_codon:yes gene_type:complete